MQRYVKEGAEILVDSRGLGMDSIIFRQVYKGVGFGHMYCFGWVGVGDEARLRGVAWEIMVD